jgi:hypothetical protein
MQKARWTILAMLAALVVAILALGGVGTARRDGRLHFGYRPDPRLCPAAAGRETRERQPGPIVRYAEAGDKAGIPGP